MKIFLYKSFFSICCITIFFSLHGSQANKKSKKRKREEQNSLVEVRPAKKQKLEAKAIAFIPKECSGLIIMLNKLFKLKNLPPELQHLIFDSMGWLPYKDIKMDTRANDGISTMFAFMPKIETLEFSAENKELHATFVKVNDEVEKVSWVVQTGKSNYHTDRQNHYVTYLLRHHAINRIADKYFQRSLKKPTIPIKCTSSDTIFLAEINGHRERNILVEGSIMVSAPRIARIIIKEEITENTKHDFVR